MIVYRCNIFFKKMVLKKINLQSVTGPLDNNWVQNQIEIYDPNKSLDKMKTLDL